MPGIVIAQAPVALWEAFFTFPVAPGNGRIVGGNGFFGGSQPDGTSYLMRPGFWGVSTVSIQSGSVGGGGVLNQYEFYKGQLCARKSTLGAMTLDSHCFPWWAPQWTGGAGVNPGYRVSALGQVVAVFDLEIAMEPTLTVTDGVFFIAYNGNTSAQNEEPAGAAPKGGFAIRATAAGGVEYVSFAQGGGALLEQIDISALIADRSDWFSVRFTIVGSIAGGGPATLTAEVNGVEFLSARQFGSAQLQDPGQGILNGYTYSLHNTVRTATGNGLFFRYSAMWGRSLPSGVSVQAE